MFKQSCQSFSEILQQDWWRTDGRWEMLWSCKHFIPLVYARKYPALPALRVSWEQQRSRHLLLSWHKYLMDPRPNQEPQFSPFNLIDWFLLIWCLIFLNLGKTFLGISKYSDGLHLLSFSLEDFSFLTIYRLKLFFSESLLKWNVEWF